MKKGEASSGYVNQYRNYDIICPNMQRESDIDSNLEPKIGIPGYAGHIHGKNSTFSKSHAIAAQEARMSWGNEKVGSAKVQQYGQCPTVSATSYVKPREDRDISAYNKAHDPAYHIPGYTGHVRGNNNLAGRTFGVQTREALTESFEYNLKHSDIPPKPNTAGRRRSIGKPSAFSVGSVGQTIQERI